jgi:hypothetical protein
MRRIVLAQLMSAFLLLACQMAAPGGGGQGLQDEAIAVTSLDRPSAEAGGAASQAPAADTQRPKPKPGDLKPAEPDAATVEDTPEPADPAAEAEPEAPKTAEQMLCETSSGQWVAAGETGAYYCASRTRDGAAKQCTRKSQCQGECLARSRTCSPVIPLYGCNDVLDKDGRQVTLCLD